MKKNIPNNQQGYERGPGAKVLSNNEWQGLQSSLNNIELGWTEHGQFTDTFSLPYDAIHTPHYGTINEKNRSKIIIGEARDEDYYPYIDTINFGINRSRFSFGNYTNFQPTAAWSFYRTTENFLAGFDKIIEADPREKTIEAGDENERVIYYLVEFKPKIVGYEATPTVSRGETIPSGRINFDIDWLPDTDLSGNYTSQIRVVDYTEDIIANQLQTYDANWITLGDLSKTAASVAILSGLSDPYKVGLLNSDIELPAFSGIVEIGEVELDSNANIERYVQLLVGNPWVQGGGAGGSKDQEEDGLRHPFKGVVSGEVGAWQIAIAPDRADADYEFKDIISIQDPRDHLAVSIPKTIGEYVDITEDSYVFYDIYLSGAVGNEEWFADLDTSTTWPPTVEPDHIYKQVGYADYQTSAVVWGQEMFECPTEQPAEVRGDFYPTYVQDKVYIAAGSVRTWEDNTEYSVNRNVFPLDTATDIWIEITSSKTTGEPSISVNSTIQSGSFPGKYQGSNATGVYCYQLGEITADGIYLPYHTGSLDLDNTLLHTDILSDVGDADPDGVIGSRVLYLGNTHKSGGIVNVGFTDNDLLLSGSVYNQFLRGGSFNKIDQETELKFRGLTQDSSQETVGWTVAAGEVALSGYPVSGVFERGLAQQLTQGVPASKLRLLEGTYIELAATDANTSTINVDTSTWTTVTVVTDVQLLSGGQLQKKTRTVLTPTAGVESGWTNAGSLSTIGCEN